MSPVLFVEQLSGLCLEASKAAKRGRLKAAAGFHHSCRGKWHTRPGALVRVCSCPCHAAAEPKKSDVEDLIAAAKAERLAKAGAAPIKRSRRTTKVCRHGHKMTKLNTGKRGECIQCKRDTAKRSRARARARKLAEQEGTS